jgi:geranylgeranyl pyrophosphate synthase
VSQVVDTSLQQFKSEDWQVVIMMGQQKYVSLFDRHWDIVCDYPSRRGKYLRPTLVLLMAEAMSGSSDTAMHTAAAMQMSEELQCAGWL